MPRTAAAERPGQAADIERAARVLEQLKAALRPGLREAVVQLDPGELGRVTVRLSLDGNTVSARMEAESPETLELIQRHLPELRAALADAGFDTAEVALTLADPSDRRPDSGAPERRDPGADRRRGPQAGERTNDHDPRPIRHGSSEVDTYA
ncbi:flagellar hook-length control protein FliK [Engelhardtia mirabilis]|uniref:flagellar hook-length control protein FliK n=1 Tax=Engelhardtia mirabilis TaxID=2528011 RepID=UPI003AF367B5